MYGKVRNIPRRNGVVDATRVLGLLLMIAAAIGARAAHAGSSSYCVSNNAQLATALLNARYSATTIKIVQGHYDLSGTVWHRGVLYDGVTIAGGSELLGGYTANCASRDIAAGNTVMDDSNANAANGGSIGGDLTIEGLTWSSPGGLTLNAYSGGDLPDLPQNSTVLIRRDVFIHTDVNALAIIWGQDPGIGGTIRVVDTLIAANTHVNCSLWIAVSLGQPKVQLVHDTVVDNTGAGSSDGSGACVRNNDGAQLSVYNNIFHGNATRDFHADQVIGALFVDNVIGPHTAVGAVEIGTLSGDPKLDANYRPIESPPSPVINSGSNSAPGGLPSTDLPGRARVIGSAPDRGAYESSVDDSFLQTVTNNNDSGVGSLRSAIAGANAHGSGLISFAIGSDCGPHVISLNSPLPALTVPAIISATAQPGYVANDLYYGDDASVCVVLESGDASVTTGLRVPSSVADGNDVHIYGLAFSGFSDSAIDLQGGSSHSIHASRFGGNAGGHTLQANGIDIRLGTGTHDVTIGGDDLADRNVIGGATGSGIAMFGSAPSGSPPVIIGTYNNQILGNFIGVGWNTAAGHATDIGNSVRGIYVAGHDNTISGNFIGANLQSGIALSGGGARDNMIEQNYIGFADAAGLYGNGIAGIRLSGDPGDAPTANTIRYNVIANNAAQGVRMDIGTQNTIRRNGIYNNGALGIDLAAVGVLPNDNDGALQTPDYANRGLNYPLLTAVAGGTQRGTFSGSLSSTLGDYRIDFYENPSGCYANDNRQGAGWIGSIAVTISVAQVGGDGIVDFAAPEGPGDLGSLPNGAGITATATDAAGNTSEFSSCVAYANDTIFANGFEPLL